MKKYYSFDFYSLYSIKNYENKYPPPPQNLIRFNLFFTWPYLFFQILICCIFTVGCNKVSLQEKYNTQEEKITSNLSNRNSTLDNGDIIEWLERQKDTSLPNRNDFILKLITNMKLEEKYTEVLSDEENLIIIPLSHDYFSQNIDPSTHQLPIQNFLIWENERGQIYRGELTLFYPKSPEITSIPENSFRHYFRSTDFPIDGTFSCINLDDVLTSESKYENEKKIKNKCLEGRWTYFDDEICTEYYLVITYYDGEGNIEDYTETYLYTSCTSGGGGAGGTGSTGTGGSSSQPGTPSTSQVDLLVRKDFVASSTHWWAFYAHWTVTGIRMNNTSLNRFNLNGITFIPTYEMSLSPGTYSWHTWWGTPSLAHTHTENINPAQTIAHGYFSGWAVFPNQNNTEINCQNHGYWNAKDVL
jgi:hypothetical protein